MKQAEPFLNFAQDPRVFLATITARRSARQSGQAATARSRANRWQCDQACTPSYETRPALASRQKGRTMHHKWI
jgi:hypothetical protein